MSVEIGGNVAVSKYGTFQNQFASYYPVGGAVSNTTLGYGATIKDVSSGCETAAGPGAGMKDESTVDSAARNVAASAAALLMAAASLAIIV